ncbi:hypothetical protein HDU93_006458 [Gonapodya sp. JEL0774]|nr:hypothetical protein HDU93_006458 [Gonapodya sp. JEL0774]
MVAEIKPDVDMADNDHEDGEITTEDEDLAMDDDISINGPVLEYLKGSPIRPSTRNPQEVVEKRPSLDLDFKLVSFFNNKDLDAQMSLTRLCLARMINTVPNEEQRGDFDAFFDSMGSNDTIYTSLDGLSKDHMRAPSLIELKFEETLVSATILRMVQGDIGNKFGAIFHLAQLAAHAHRARFVLVDLSPALGIMNRIALANNNYFLTQNLHLFMKPIKPVFFGGLISRFMHRQNDEATYNTTRYLLAVEEALRQMTTSLPHNWHGSREFYESVLARPLPSHTPPLGTAAVIKEYLQLAPISKRESLPVGLLTQERLVRFKARTGRWNKIKDAGILDRVSEFRAIWTNVAIGLMNAPAGVRRIKLNDV